eukprot:scaffold28759_cov70-Cyclotella_meneghiniana.AAC.2
MVHLLQVRVRAHPQGTASAEKSCNSNTPERARKAGIENDEALSASPLLLDVRDHQYLVSFLELQFAVRPFPRNRAPARRPVDRGQKGRQGRVVRALP